MTKVRIGNIEATLIDFTWSSSSEETRRLLQAFTDGLTLHGGTPNVEQAIVIGLAKELPIAVTETDYVEPNDEHDEVIF